MGISGKVSSDRKTEKDRLTKQLITSTWVRAIAQTTSLASLEALYHFDEAEISSGKKKVLNGDLLITLAELGIAISDTKEVTLTDKNDLSAIQNQIFILHIIQLIGNVIYIAGLAEMMTEEDSHTEKTLTF